MAEKAAPSHGSVFDFGALAQEYELWYESPDGQAHDRIQREDVRRLLRDGLADERLLDVGCGTGHWSSFFSQMGYQVTGIDVSPKMIEVARSTAPGCSFQVGDACDLPFSDGSFDVVAAMAALEFMPNPAAAVREMVRCAKPGGSLLIGTLNRLASLNLHRLSQGKQPYASAHLFSPNELRRFLAPLGRVRVVASSPRRLGRGSSLLGGVAGRLGLLRGETGGPFIVAEVRL